MVGAKDGQAKQTGCCGRCDTHGQTNRNINMLAEQARAGAELLTAKQMAKYCGIGERTLWRYAHSGISPAPVKIGPGKQGAVRFVRSQYEQWIAVGCPRIEGGMN